MSVGADENVDAGSRRQIQLDVVALAMVLDHREAERLLVERRGPAGVADVEHSVIETAY